VYLKLVGANLRVRPQYLKILGRTRRFAPTHSQTTTANPIKKKQRQYICLCFITHKTYVYNLFPVEQYAQADRPAVI